MLYLIHNRNSWPPGKTKACPPEGISVQVLMASLISPHVLNAFNEPPKDDVETLDDAGRVLRREQLHTATGMVIGTSIFIIQ
jgi:hypothetical protein